MQLTEKTINLALRTWNELLGWTRLSSTQPFELETCKAAMRLHTKDETTEEILDALKLVQYASILEVEEYKRNKC